MERQIDLFGAADATRSLMGERVAVLDAALGELRRDKRLFGTLARSADAIEGAGNVLARGTNERRATDAAGLEDILVRLARRSGPISDALNVQAGRVAEGTARSAAARAFLGQLQGRGRAARADRPPEGAGRTPSATTIEPGSPEAARIGEQAAERAARHRRLRSEARPFLGLLRRRKRPCRPDQCARTPGWPSGTQRRGRACPRYRLPAGTRGGGRGHRRGPRVPDS